MPFGSPGDRVAQVGEAIRTVRKLFADGTFTPVQRPAPPILVAGAGTRLLRLAAEEADIVAVHAGRDNTEDGLRARLPVLREAAGSRFDELELSVNVFAVGDGPIPERLRQFGIDRRPAGTTRTCPCCPVTRPRWWTCCAGDGTSSACRT